MENRNKDRLFYTLDNIGIIYPAVINPATPMLFRFSSTFFETINASVAQQAIESILPRFPIMRTHLKHGFFWAYLEESFDCPYVENDEYQCFGYNAKNSKNYPFRVRLHGSQMSLEISHLITDGKGALIFFKAIIVQYLTLLGNEFDDYGDIITNITPFNNEEITDMYSKHFFKKGEISKVHRKRGEAFREKDIAQNAPFFKYIRCTVPLDKTLQVAKRFNTTLTVLLVSLYVQAYQNRMYLLPPNKKNRKPIRITVPADLRTLIPSKTTRNFIGLINLEIDNRLEPFSFEEIINSIHHSLKRELNTKHFLPYFRYTSASQKDKVISYVPLFIKKIYLKQAHSCIMKKETGVVSNMGAVVFPDEIAKLIKDFTSVPAAKVINRRDCNLVSFKNNLHITISRVCENDIVERYFYDSLRDMGLEVEVNKFSNFN